MSSAETPEISVVVPLYNEQENVPELHRRLVQALDFLGEPYEIVFVDDGSRDADAPSDRRVAGGGPEPLGGPPEPQLRPPGGGLGGPGPCPGQAVIVMDGDLQDPPEVIPQFVERWRDGTDVVYAVRRRRKEGA